MTETEKRELDAFCATEVMGWIHGVDGYGSPSWFAGREPRLKASWKPTTDSAAAMKVLRKCAEHCEKLGIERGYDVDFSISMERGKYFVGCDIFIECMSADTLELALALFAKQLFSK